MHHHHRLLLVTDSREVETTIQHHLSTESHSIEWSLLLANSGEIALRKVQTQGPDCILLDSNLPDMTALEFLQQFPSGEGKPAIPLIILANQGNEATAVQVIKMGADDYLTLGDLTPHKLTKSIKSAITNAALAQSMREHRAHIQLDHVLEKSNTLEEGASQILDVIGREMNWQACSLWVPNSSKTHLRCVGRWQNLGLLSHCQQQCSQCQTFSQHTYQSILAPNEDLPGQCWTTGTMVMASDLSCSEQNPRFQLAQALGLKGAIAYPLCLKGEIVAIFECWYQFARQISPERISILTTFTNQITRFLERRRAEQFLRKRETEYRLVMDHVPALIASYDEHRRFRLANKAFQEWLNKPEESILGHPAQEVLGNSLYREMGPYMDQVMSGDKVNFELSLPGPEGTRQWVNATFVPDISEEGTIKGFYSLISDISHRKDTEERLRLQAQKLAQSNAELEQFAHIASHDLQEPLRKIQAFSDRLRSRAATILGPQELEYLERMHKATQRMQTLIRDLLAFSRVGTQPQPFQPVDLREVVAEVLNDLETLIARTGAHIDCEQLPEIYGDPTQIRQLFQNLIGNGLKFQKGNRPPHVRIFIKELDSRFDHANPDSPLMCCIGVQDNGIGFDPQYADRIFGVFQRLHGRDEYEGTGIGLSICKKVVERHGGTITAESIPGKGSTFWVTLPLCITNDHVQRKSSMDKGIPRQPTIPDSPQPEILIGS